MKYRKKPLVIEAFRFGSDDVPDWFVIGNFITKTTKSIKVNTQEGCIQFDAGNYIIKGIKGEVYPCKADIFEATYEKVEE